MLRSLLMSLVFTLCGGFSVLSSPAHAAQRPINYSKVKKAEVERVREHLLVRYVLTADDPCLTIQYLKPGHPGVFLREKTICSLGAARFDRDFALVDFKSIEFANDHLHMEIEFIPSRRGRKSIRHCVIRLNLDSIEDLACWR